MKAVWFIFAVIITKLKYSGTFATEVIGNYDQDSIQISLLPDYGKISNVSDNAKSILRYGFQQIKECQEYDKAFLCIRKCLDLGYQIAHANKQCLCTCKYNRHIAKHKPTRFGPTKWRLGAPSTSIPHWIKKHAGKLAAKYQERLEHFEGSEKIAHPIEDHVNSYVASNQTERTVSEKTQVPDDNATSTSYMPTTILPEQQNDTTTSADLNITTQSGSN